MVRRKSELFVHQETSITDIARRIAEETGGFTGGNVDLFAAAGKYSFDSLKKCGLVRTSRVLDYGCGALRLGYRLVRFLDPDRYFGIEPSKKFLDAGIKHAIGPELMAEKRPRFHCAGDFDFSVFGEKFDFLIARSIFSHASPEQFLKSMDSFRDNSAAGGIMLASYRPLRPRDGKADIVDPNPDGRDWRLRRYALSYLQDRARERGLFADNFDEPFNGQVWLRLSRRELQD